MKYQYFKIKKDRQEWLGEKYYRVADDTDSVLCVVRMPGEGKRGRPNTIGIFFITKQSFASNVFMYVEMCMVKDFSKAFNIIHKMML